MDGYVTGVASIEAEEAVASPVFMNNLLAEILNIVGERERPNLGFARDVRAA